MGDSQEDGSDGAESKSRLERRRHVMWTPPPRLAVLEAPTSEIAHNVATRFNDRAMRCLVQCAKLAPYDNLDAFRRGVWFAAGRYFAVKREPPPKARVRAARRSAELEALMWLRIAYIDARNRTPGVTTKPLCGTEDETIHAPYTATGRKKNGRAIQPFVQVAEEFLAILESDASAVELTNRLDADRKWVESRNAHARKGVLQKQRVSAPPA